MELENRDGIKQQNMANWIQIKAGNIHLYFVAFRRITGAADVISRRLQSPPVASWRRVAILLLLHWPHTTLPASKRA